MNQQNLVKIDNSVDFIEFLFKGKNLIFQRINPDTQDGISFSLSFKDAEQIGFTFCRTDRFKSQAWYLDTIEIFSQFQRCGYGSKLLDLTCDALWKRNKAEIMLERPANTTSPDGFDRKVWYQNHGFEAHPDPKITFMWRAYQPAVP